MTLFDLLKLSPAGKKYLEKVKKVNPPWVRKADKIMTSLRNEQTEVIQKNFKGIKSIDQLLDKLSEIMIGYQYLDKKPTFFSTTRMETQIFGSKISTNTSK